MSNENFKSFTDVILSQTPTILGLKLQPYSLGHQIILKKAKSVFVGDNFFKSNDVTIVCELVFALLVCSTTHDVFMEEFQSGKTPQLIADYVHSIRKGIAGSKEIKSIKEAVDALARETELFLDYIKKGTTTQQFVKLNNGEDGFKPNAIEFELTLKEQLQTDCGYSRDEALNLPMTETLASFLLLGHKRGVVEVESKEVWELKRKMKGLPV